MRLTELVNKGMNETPIYVGSYGNIVNVGDNQATSMVHGKLGQLEDIEDELGIDLITLFKALNGCWFLQIDTKKALGDIRPTLVYQCGWHLRPKLSELPMLYALKDYGKTWALTKEELE